MDQGHQHKTRYHSILEKTVGDALEFIGTGKNFLIVKVVRLTISE